VAGGTRTRRGWVGHLAATRLWMAAAAAAAAEAAAAAGGWPQPFQSCPRPRGVGVATAKTWPTRSKRVAVSLGGGAPLAKGARVFNSATSGKVFTRSLPFSDLVPSKTRRRR